MARNVISRCHLLRRLIIIGRSCSSSETLVSKVISSPSPSNPSRFSFNTSIFVPNSSLTDHSLMHYRPLCSPSGSSSTVSIKSEEEFNRSLSRVQDESLPAIFYFTAVWCGPCRLLAPAINELSEKYPQVTIFKVDIDQEGLGRTLSNLSIFSVPTLHFFKDGKKTAEIVGADVARTKETMEKLYNA